MYAWQHVSKTGMIICPLTRESTHSRNFRHLLWECFFFTSAHMFSVSAASCMSALCFLIDVVSLTVTALTHYVHTVSLATVWTDESKGVLAFLARRHLLLLQGFLTIDSSGSWSLFPQWHNSHTHNTGNICFQTKYLSCFSSGNASVVDFPVSSPHFQPIGFSFSKTVSSPDFTAFFNLIWGETRGSCDQVCHFYECIGML